MKTGKRLVGLIISIALLIATGIIGVVTDIFFDAEDYLQQMHIKPVMGLKVLIVIVMLYALNCIVQLILEAAAKGKGRARTLATVSASLIKYAFVIIGFCWSLSIIGVNVSTICASVGIVALVLGFGAETLVADIVTGIFILFENQFNIGDIIEVDGFRGSVENIGIRTICLRDTGDNLKIINNSDLKNIINRSAQSSLAITDVGVSYATDLDELEKKIGGILQSIKQKRSDVFIGAIEYLGVEELADSCVVLRIKAEVMEKDIFKGRRILNKEIKCAFDRANIEIAFPQLDIHNR
ncbi:MAG: mechanosensitive ion channel family protein [Lachnospiraceae bacterium]|nr:mechanosensitive ion channel family protein [Lachnospiraceae bacterium]